MFDIGRIIATIMSIMVIVSLGKLGADYADPEIAQGLHPMAAVALAAVSASLIAWIWTLKDEA